MESEHKSLFPSICLGSRRSRPRVEALNIVIFGNLTLNYCKSLFFFAHSTSATSDRMEEAKLLLLEPFFMLVFFCLFNGNFIHRSVRNGFSKNNPKPNPICITRESLKEIESIKCQSTLIFYSNSNLHRYAPILHARSNSMKPTGLTRHHRCYPRDPSVLSKLHFLLLSQSADLRVTRKTARFIFQHFRSLF